MILDEICLMQEAGRQIHTLAANAEHVTEKLLCQPELVLTFAIRRLQQPSAHPFLYRVMLDAGAILCSTLNENERVTQQ